MSPRTPGWLRRMYLPEGGGLACVELVELVTDYLEDALPERVRERFEAHVSSCVNCNAYLDQFRETIRVVGALTPDDLTPAMEHELLAAFRGWREQEA